MNEDKEYHSHLFEDFKMVTEYGFHEKNNLIGIALLGIATLLSLIYIVSTSYLEQNWYIIIPIILIYLAAIIMFFIPSKKNKTMIDNYIY